MKLYAISAGGQFIKFGVTTDIDKRMVRIQGNNPLPLKLLYLSDGMPRKVALAVERVIHKAAVSYHVTGEWFKSCPKTLAIVGLLEAKGLDELSEILNKWAREELRFCIKQKFSSRKDGMYSQPLLKTMM